MSEEALLAKGGVHDPQNPRTTSSPGSSRTEKLSPVDEYALAEARQDGVAMAKALLKTCPHDWCSGWNINAKGVLLRLIQGEKPHEVRPMAMMRFLWQAAQDADNLVAHFGLPVPREQCCLMWDRWTTSEEEESQINGVKYSSAFHFILNDPMQPDPIEDFQGYPFPRFAQYVATAVALADISLEQQDELLRNMSNFMLKERKRRAESFVQIAGKKRAISEVDGST